jgi:hypothetical protein
MDNTLVQDEKQAQKIQVETEMFTLIVHVLN